MTGRRRIAAVALPAVAAALLLPAVAGPARAHGAPTDPVSRTAVCGLEGAQRASGACRAAVAANGGAIGAWDNLRLPGVGGRDRAAVPDGRLCSAGLDAYRGLDAARADWPATPLKAGGTFTLTYRSTIPHQGTFELYLTRQGYDPARALTWADLDTRPFATATDPALEDGAYRIGARLPTGLTGRHVLYVVWRNTDTPDTYYSCSDLVLTPDEDVQQSGAQPGPPPPPAPAAPPASPPQSAPAPPAPDATPAPTPSSAPSSAPAPAPASAGGVAGERATILVGVGAAALALVFLCGSLVLRRRRGI
ncbi:lytic polysaccharide monooxygenase [Streptomyces sp. NPDC054802]